MTYRRTYVQVDLRAICDNARVMRQLLGRNCRLLAVVKADAYGHGAQRVAYAMEQEGVASMFGVATVEEGIELRMANITRPILLLGYTSPAQAEMILQYDLIPTVYRVDVAEQFASHARAHNTGMRVHLAVDSGMSRIGFPVTKEGMEDACRVAAMDGLIIDGIFTHFAKADEEELSFSHTQAERFFTFARALEKNGVKAPLMHLCNSAATVQLGAYHASAVRCGIVLYGASPSACVHDGRLRPAMQWKSCVTHVKTVPAGTAVSYSGTWVSRKPTVIATVPVGYADGYPRSLSNVGSVLIHGKRAPIVGRVCMDQMMVDVSEIPDVQMEDSVVLLGRDGQEEITLEELGELSGRFVYEFPCMISKRVPRVYLQ